MSIPSPRPLEAPHDDDLLDALGVGVAAFDGDGRLVRFNDAFSRLWGLDAVWLARRPGLGDLFDRLRADRRLAESADPAAERRRLLASLRAPPAPEQTLLHRPDGRVVRRLARARAQGGLLWLDEDVTERLELERSLNALTAVQRASLDNLLEGAAVFGADGRLATGNAAFKDLWGLEQSLQPGVHLRDLTPVMASRLADGESTQPVEPTFILSRRPAEGRLSLADGRTVAWAQVPLPDGSVLLRHLDVSDGTRLAGALAARDDAMRDAEAIKRAFLGNLSYEVRGPLTTISGFADMLGEGLFGELTPRQGTYVEGIRQASATLGRVLDHALELALIDAGLATADRRTVDLHALLARTLLLVRERARHKDLALTLECPLDIGCLEADERRLSLAVACLLENAVAYTPPRGQVTLSAEKRKEAMVVKVRDTGVGLTRDEREKVMAPFARGAAGSGGDGAGLGLTLAARLVELHGGGLDLTSARNRGTVVTLILPLPA